MNSAELQRKAKVMNACDNALWAAILIAEFGILGVSFYTDVKFPHPISIISIACMILVPILGAVMYMPIKFVVLRAINFRCTSCNKYPPIKTVSFVLEYSFCPCCHKPFITDPAEDILKMFAYPATQK